MSHGINLEYFKTNKRFHLVLVACIIGSFGLSLIPNMVSHDTYPDFYLWEKPFLQSCSLIHYPKTIYSDDPTLSNSTGSIHEARNPVKWWFNCLSYKIDGYENIIPGLFSIGILAVSYLTFYTMTKNRIASAISLGALAINPLFYSWTVSATYDQAWSFFMVLSIYYIFKGSKLSIPSYLLSLASKALVLTYLPLMIYSIFKTDQSRKTKYITTSLITIPLLALALIMNYHSNIIGSTLGFYPNHLLDGLNRAVAIIIWELPVLFAFLGMEVMFRKSGVTIPHRNTALIWMTGIASITPFVYLFSGQFMFPYRYTIWCIFFSLYIGIVLTKIVYSFELIYKSGIKSKS